MSQYDNEIYRGPPESGPTLAQDTPSYGTDFHIVKPPQATVQQDVPATEETDRQESRPAVKKKSRIGKAMKLLASCAATVAVVTALAAPAEPVQELPLWSSYGPIGGAYGGYDFSVPSQNSGDCQVSIGGKAYCLTAQQEGMYLLWMDTYDASQDGSYGSFAVEIEKPAEGLMMYLEFSVQPLQAATDIEGIGQIQTTSGDTFYVRGGWAVAFEDGMPHAQQVIDNLDDYLQISDATDDGWDNVFIGNTMYSETNEEWNGVRAVNFWRDNGAYWDLHICTTGDATYSADDLLCQHRVNGIDWSFYYAMYNGEPMIWAVPAQEEIAFGHYAVYLLDKYGVDPTAPEQMSGSNIQGELRDTLLDIIERYIIGWGLKYYHLVEQMPGYESSDIPTNTTEVPATEATVDVPEATTQPATEATTQATTKATEPPLTFEVVESYFDSDGGSKTIDYYDQQGTPVKQEWITYDNQGNVLRKKVYDYYYGYRIVKTEEWFTYYESGYPSTYSIRYYERLYSNYIGSELVEFYSIEYDESGAVIDTDRNTIDWERGLSTYEDYEYSYGVTFGDSDKSWAVDVYIDGVYSNEQLVEGVFQETFRETGNLYHYTQRNADGSFEYAWYYTDGSLEQSGTITIDEETNTWIKISEYHPIPSVDFAYHNETRVRFDDNGKVIGYYDNSDGYIIEIQFDENDQTEAEYDENGRMIKCRHSENGYLTEIWFEYDQFGRLEEVGSNTWRE